MRRTGGWPRKVKLQAKTQLRSRSELRNTKPLEAGKGLKRSELVSRKPRRSKQEEQGRRLVGARAGLSCEGCGLQPWSEWSHRIARSRGGTWRASNGLALCASCHHDICHGEPEIARALGWVVRTGRDTSTVPASLAGRGLVLLADDGSVTPYKREAA
jgi:hypothetical protein